MKNIKNNLTTLVAFAIMLASCTDDGKNPLPTITKGGFAKFATEVLPSTFDNAQNIAFTGTIEDFNNNLVEYTLAVTGVIGGEEYTNDNFVTFTSFPATLEVNSQNLADALGLDKNDFYYGDSFSFVATVTTNGGIVYIGTEPKTGKNDDDMVIITGGNTDSKLLKRRGYKGAMAFDTVVACAFVQEEVIGTYTVIYDNWNDFSAGQEVTIVAGDTKDTYRILVEHSFIANPTTCYFEVTVDLKTGASTLESNEPIEYIGWTNIPVKGKGLTIACAGIIDLSLDYYFTASTGWWGYGLKLQKI